MEDDVIEFRNGYYVDEDDWRNGNLRNRRVIVRGGGSRGPWQSSGSGPAGSDRGGSSSSPPSPVPYYPPSPVPYYPPSSPMGYPQASPLGRVFNTSTPVLVDAAAQLLAALSSQPAQPNVVNTADASKDAYANLANLIEYQRALASYAKRNEQIRTVGALAKLLMA